MSWNNVFDELRPVHRLDRRRYHCHWWQGWHVLPGSWAVRMRGTYDFQRDDGADWTYNQPPNCSESNRCLHGYETIYSQLADPHIDNCMKACSRNQAHVNETAMNNKHRESEGGERGVSVRMYDIMHVCMYVCVHICRHTPIPCVFQDPFACLHL